jgi:lysophospholipase L1-like esterase
MTPKGNHAMTINRRTMVKTSAAAAITGALMSADGIADSTNEANVKLDKGDVVLFQGDSITDAGRDKQNPKPNDFGSLGRGYAMMISSQLLARFPGLGLQCHNRGISGHKVPDLQGRWERDCITLKPALLSILIGVNDIWHKLNGNYDGTPKDYEAQLDRLLAETRSKLPSTPIVICEPFVLRCGAISDKWFPEFDERRAACRRISDKHKCIWVPFQSMFDKGVTEETPANYWAGDGVHPSMAGHALMASTWLQTVFG